MSDDPVRIPPRLPPPGGAPVRTQEKRGAEAKGGALAKKKMEDPNATANLGADSFSRAIQGSSQIRGKILPGPTASILFTSSPEPATVGELRQNGQLVVKYDPVRAKLTQNDFGPASWGVKAVIKFMPGGELEERPAVEFENRPGRPNVARPSAMTLKIPLTATTVEIFFKNWKRGAADYLDNNGGAGFRFGIQPPAKQQQLEG